MESRPNNPTCPVCKSVIDKDKLIPLYGRGSGNKDPRDNIPPRPQGQREEAPEEEEVNTSLRIYSVLAFSLNTHVWHTFSLSLSLSLSLLQGMFGGMGGGINVSFGFPFMGPMFQMGNMPMGQFHQRRAGVGMPNRRHREEQQRLARIFVTIAILIIILIIFS